MQHHRAKWLLVTVLLVLVASGCRGGSEPPDLSVGPESEEAVLEAEPSPEATPDPEPEPVPPVDAVCYGLPQVDRLPEWAGGLEFGQAHQSAGSSMDLSNLVGCEFDGGVLGVHTDGSLVYAFVDSCADLESDDLPTELRPKPDAGWFCREPSPDGGTLGTFREG